jgi:hypothetical protein
MSVTASLALIFRFTSEYALLMKAMNIFMRMNCIEVMKAMKRKKERVG